MEFCNSRCKGFHVPYVFKIHFDSKFLGSNYHEQISSCTSLFAVFDAIVDIAVS